MSKEKRKVITLNEARLGEGAEGIVFRVKYELAHPVYAFKFWTTSDGDRRENSIKAVVEQQKQLKDKFPDSRNILRSCFRWGERVTASECIEDSLHSVLWKLKPLERLTLFHSLIQGVREIHTATRKGVCDLKPSNILVRRKNANSELLEAVFIDFGGTGFTKNYIPKGFSENGDRKQFDAYALAVTAAKMFFYYHDDNFREKWDINAQTTTGNVPHEPGCSEWIFKEFLINNKNFLTWKRENFQAPYVVPVLDQLYNIGTDRNPKLQKSDFCNFVKKSQLCQRHNEWAAHLSTSLLSAYISKLKLLQDISELKKKKKKSKEENLLLDNKSRKALDKLVQSIMGEEAYKDKKVATLNDKKFKLVKQWVEKESYGEKTLTDNEIGALKALTSTYDESE